MFLYNTYLIDFTTFFHLVEVFIDMLVHHILLTFTWSLICNLTGHKKDLGEFQWRFSAERKLLILIIISLKRFSMLWHFVLLPWKFILPCLAPNDSSLNVLLAGSHRQHDMMKQSWHALNEVKDKRGPNLIVFFLFVCVLTYFGGRKLRLSFYLDSPIQIAYKPFTVTIAGQMQDANAGDEFIFSATHNQHKRQQ